MANKNGWTTIGLSPQVMDAYVLPMQQRIFEDTGIRVAPAVVVRRLLELGAAAETLNNVSNVSSGAQ